MRTVRIFRAQGIHHLDDVEPVTIVIDGEIPDVHDRARSFHASEGAALADAIWSSCPGGTVDALLVALMTRRASVLRVPLPAPNGGPA